MANILVVDDDPDLRDLQKVFLLSEGYKVYLAKNGIEGIEAVKRIKPDLVLLDVNMPDLNGWEVSRLIKEDSNIRKTKIAMVTTESAYEAKLKSLGPALANWHISKPFTRKKYLRTVNWILGKDSEELELNSKVWDFINKANRGRMDRSYPFEDDQEDPAITHDMAESFRYRKPGIGKGFKRVFRYISRINSELAGSLNKFINRLRKGDNSMNIDEKDFQEIEKLGIGANPPEGKILVDAVFIPQKLYDSIELLFGSGDDLKEIANLVFNPVGKEPYYFKGTAMHNMLDLAENLDRMSDSEATWAAFWIEYLGDESTSKKIMKSPHKFREIVRERCMELFNFIVMPSTPRKLELEQKI